MKQNQKSSVDGTRVYASRGLFREQERKPCTDTTCLPRRDERATRVHRVPRKGPHTESRCMLAAGIPVLFWGAGGSGPWLSLMSVKEWTVPMSQATSTEAHGPDPCIHMLGVGCQAPNRL